MKVLMIVEQKEPKNPHEKDLPDPKDSYMEDGFNEGVVARKAQEKEVDISGLARYISNDCQLLPPENIEQAIQKYIQEQG